MIPALIAALTLTTTAPSGEPLRLLDEWIAAVEFHAPGERDAAVEKIGAWTGDDLGVMLAYVEALTDVPANNPDRQLRRRRLTRVEMTTIAAQAKELQTRGRFDEFRKRAAILHSDVALFGYRPRRAAGASVSRSQRSARGEFIPSLDVRQSDGRVENYESANPHWEYARSILESLPARPKRDPIVAQWYRAIGAHFAQQDNVADGIPHFERASRIVDDDPGVLYGAACLQETLGGPAVQNFARVTRLPAGLTLQGVSSFPQTHFHKAESLLKRALETSPDFIEARLRLGRVLSALHNYDEALPHLQRVISESKDPELTYFARLFAGDAFLALNRLAESRQSYEQALATHPRSQSAHIGLAATLRAAGDRDGAVAEVMKTMTVSRDDREDADDPWWRYYTGEADSVERLLQALWAPFKSPGR